MNLTTQQLRALGYAVAGGKAVPAAPDKPRARRFTGRLSQWKEFVAEQQRGPGVFLPLRCLNWSNRSAHWKVKAKAAKEQRGLVCLALRRVLPLTWGEHVDASALPATVTLTRYGIRLMDDDGNQRALKAVRDGVADAFGTNDGPDGGLTFEYGQEVSRHYGVRIEMAAGKDTP
jgi:hypothetical protein